MIRLLDNNMKFFSTERMGRIQLKIATLLLILCFHITAIHATFTCQGTSYAAALRRCPDNGQQRMSSGGNVRILVKDVDNLPNSDVTTLSDPYVKFTAGKVSVSTSFKSNTLNPTWNEYVNIGFLGSATLITVEIWDHDTGIEFGDDLLVKASVRVPYCSTMHANITKLDCGMPFNCESTESLWAMPERQLCSESFYVSFFNGKLCNQGGICLNLEFNIVPFTMDVELEFDNALLLKPQITVAGSNAIAAPWATTYGLPYLFDSLTNIQVNNPFFQQLRGSLMFRMLDEEKSYGPAEAIKFYAGINFPAFIYVCRNELDNDFGIPNWLQNAYSSRNNSIMRVNLFDSDEDFLCYYSYSGGTTKNKWGGVIDNPIPFFTNTLKGSDGNTLAEQALYQNMYIILAVPQVVAPRDDEVNIKYNFATFMGFFGAYGIVWILFMLGISNFLKKIRYRVDRIISFIASRVLTGDDSTILAGLLLHYGQTPKNIDYRANLYHLRNVYVFILILPFALLLSWGMSCVERCEPAGLGYLVAFGGWACLFSWFALRLWESCNWRLTPIAAGGFSAAILSLVVFLLCIIFSDPGVIDFGWGVNIAALSLIFGMINVIPLLLLIFQQDNTQKSRLKELCIKLTEAVYILKDQLFHADVKLKDLRINKLVHALLGEKYTANPKLPVFRLSTVIQEFSFDTILVAPQQKKNADTFSKPVSEMESHSGSAKPTLTPANLTLGTPDFPPTAGIGPGRLFSSFDLSEPWSYELKLYLVSLLVLLIYVIIAGSTVTYSSLALLNCLTLILLDVIHENIGHGDIGWTPGFKVFLLLMGRVLVMGSSNSLWILNYSAAFLLYSIVLLTDVINNFLPVLSFRKAGEIVFSGRDIDDPRSSDLSGTSYFCLVLLTFSFIVILCISAFQAARGDLLSSHVKVFGAYWRIDVFGMIALLVTVNFGLFSATVRAFYLNHYNLLRGRARDCYLWRKEINTPIILGLASYIFFLASGLLVYISTGAAAVLIGCMYIPIIIGCFSYSYYIWVKNDYELVVWPPKKIDAFHYSNAEEVQEELNVMFSDLQNRFRKGDMNSLELENIESIEEEEPESVEEAQKVAPKTLKGFKLPALKATGNKLDSEVKMPALPLKSVLRNKRQNLGIKTKLPLIKDLRGREDAVDNDKFGDTDDVVDAADPWAQFEVEENDEEDALIRHKKINRLKGSEFVCMKYFNRIRDAWKQVYKNSTCMQFIVQKCKELYRFLSNNNTKVHPTSKRYDVSDNLDSINIYGDGEESGKVSEEQSPSTSSKKRRQNAGADGGDFYANEPIIDENELAIQKDLSRMPFGNAVLKGYLAQDEYFVLGTWNGGLFFVMLFGITLSIVVSPIYLGYVMWVATWSFIFMIIPIVKYFNTYTFDDTMQNMVKLLALLHLVFFFSFLLAQYSGDFEMTGAVWTIAYFFYYPVFVYVCFEMYLWYDNGFRSAPLDFNHDGKISFSEYIRYLRSFPAILVAFVLFNWLLYVWESVLIGQIFTLVIVVSALGFLFLRDWTANDFFLSPELSYAGDIIVNITLLVTLLVAVFNESNPIFSISVFCFTFVLKCLAKLVSKYMITARDTLVYFSPYVMPMYFYDASTQDVIDESRVAKIFIYLVLTAVFWGCLMAVFVYPVDIGVALVCCFLLALAAVCSVAVGHLPVKLAKTSVFLSADAVVEAVKTAKEKFIGRKLPLNLEFEGWDEFYAESQGQTAIADKLDENPFASFANISVSRPSERVDKTALEKLKEKQCIEIAVEMLNETRSLKHIKEEKIESHNVNLEEEDEYELPWYRQLVVDIKEGVKFFLEHLPINKKSGWKRHSEALWTVKDAIAHLIITGKGPYGLLGGAGYVYRLLHYLKEHPNPRFHKYVPKWYDDFDEFGNNKTRIDRSESLDLQGILTRLTYYDEALDYTFLEESRCAIHFLLLLRGGAEATLSREKVLFQKFLRENKGRLATNGITPPRDIFTSSSFASINIPLVATWLSTLSVEERLKFNSLKASFSEEQREKDLLIDEHDNLRNKELEDIKNEQLSRDFEFSDRLNQQIYKQKEWRIQSFANSLEGYYKVKFAQRRELWCSDLDCYVESKEKDLYDMFKNACLVERDELKEHVENQFRLFETGQKDTRSGEYGRSIQFLDSEFPPGENSLGNGEGADSVLGWRCSVGINDNVQIFDGGTLPDDIEQGVFKNSWLAAALCMLVTSSDYGNGIINEAIRNMFVEHSREDGETTLETDVGAYCIKFFKNGEWIPVIIDDLLPMRKKEYWTTENRGMACSHNRECRGIWVALIEKAYAKYFGTYSAIERGAVHYALQDMTGCEAECIPLSSVSRGVGKRALWDSLVQYKKNGYVLGAGTGPLELADKGTKNIGIGFDSLYTIYDVIQCDGHQLVKLRNPPGSTEIWKGDWGEKSAVWNRRYRQKLILSEKQSKRSKYTNDRAISRQLSGELTETMEDNVNPEGNNGDMIELEKEHELTAQEESLTRSSSFIMSFDDFCNVFRHVYVCKYYNPKKWNTKILSSIWKKSDEAAVEQMDLMTQFMMEGGEDENVVTEIDQVDVNRKKAKARLDCSGGLPTRHNPGCILENNPFFTFEVAKPTDFRITVTQINTAGTSAYQPHPITIMVIRNPHPHVPMRLKKIVKEDVMAISGDPQAARMVHLYGAIPPGLYIILVATYMAGMEGSFDLSVVTNTKNELSLLWPPSWMIKQNHKGELHSDQNINGKLAKKVTDAKVAKGAAKVNNFVSKGFKSLFGAGEDDLNDDDDKDDDSSDGEDARNRSRSHRYDEELGT